MYIYSVFPEGHYNYHYKINEYFTFVFFFIFHFNFYFKFILFTCLLTLHTISEFYLFIIFIDLFKLPPTSEGRIHRSLQNVWKR